MASMKPLKSTFLLISTLLLSLHLSQTTADEDQISTVDLHSSGLILVKIYCLIILFTTTFAGGVSPYFYRWNESFLLLGTQFAGGVFLGTSLMHFLSDSVQTFATKGEAWKNLWTISLHKIFAAISMGIALLRMLPKRPFLTTAAYSFAFAISSPLGVGIGIAIDATTQGPGADWTYAISMGLACGVFIYVAINHLIAKGFKPQEHFREEELLPDESSAEYLQLQELFCEELLESGDLNELVLSSEEFLESGGDEELFLDKFPIRNGDLEAELFLGMLLMEEDMEEEVESLLV
ncbi:hypothetical protein C3L33_04538, partial [Rhododendron williamsianum]